MLCTRRDGHDGEHVTAGMLDAIPVGNFKLRGIFVPAGDSDIYIEVTDEETPRP